jgi:hypothetical protein
MPTLTHRYHCFQRGNAKKTTFSEEKRPFPEGKTLFLQKSGVVGHLSGRARRPRGAQRALRQRGAVDEDMDGFRSDDDPRIAAMRKTVPMVNEVRNSLIDTSTYSP